MDGPESAELDVRLAALRAGFWLGWLSVAAVMAGLALGLSAQHGTALFALTGAAALANAAVVAVPRRWWMVSGRGNSMLMVWSAGLILLVAALVLIGGGHADLDLLMFLVLPFLATVHTGATRTIWLTIAFVTILVVMAAAPDRLPTGQIALRICLMAAATMLALALAELTRRAASARAELAAQAKLERELLAEAHHRVKNSLQTVSDLLLLGRPSGPDGVVFDETANRIRSIAVVHRLLSEERGASVDAAELLALIAEGVAPDAQVHANGFQLPPTCAQHLGVVANELIANAVRHGRAPIDVDLHADDTLELIVRDAGSQELATTSGLGLQLVDRVVSDGLHGTFDLRRTDAGTTEARVRFDPEGACVS